MGAMRRSRQSGQTMVIVALLSVAMIGALGLGIDGGRLYIERRVDQNAADAAALAMADAYYGAVQQKLPTPFVTAFDAGIAEFGVATHQAGTWTPSGGVPTTCDTAPNSAGNPYPPTGVTAAGNVVQYTLNGYTVLLSAWKGTNTQSICVFNAVANHSISAVFMQVLNGGLASIPASVYATAVAAHQFIPPTMLVLQPSNGSTGSLCTKSGGAGEAWQVQGSGGGSGSLNIFGDAWTNGNLKTTQATIAANGNVFDVCDDQPTVGALPISCKISSPCAFGGQHPLTDPLLATFTPKCCSTGQQYYVSPYTLPSPSDSLLQAKTVIQGNKTTPVQIEPGIFSTTNSLPDGCFFAEPGIYTWANTGVHALAMQSQSIVISNELTPPDGVNPSTIDPAPISGTSTSPEITATSQPFTWSLPTSNASVTNKAQTCLGKIVPYILTTPGAGTRAGTYYVRASAVRKESVPGTSNTTYWRESYLSNPSQSNGTSNGDTLYSGCLPVTLTSDQSLEVGFSNIPGMGNPHLADLHDTGLLSEYHVYASTTGCDGPFGLVGKAGFCGQVSTDSDASCAAGYVQNNFAIAGCPGGLPATTYPVAQLPATAPLPDIGTASATCTLGYTGSTVIGGAAVGGLNHDGYLGASWPVPTGSSPYCDPATFTSGCQPPYINAPGDASLAADTANEDECVDKNGAYCSSSPFPNAGSATPGGAMFYFPNNTNCIFQTNSAAFIFAALQWNSVALYVQHGSTCTATINGGGGGMFIGESYLPGPTPPYTAGTAGVLLTIAGGGTPIDGGLIVWSVKLTGNSATTLTGRFPRVVEVTPARLIVCTNGGDLTGDLTTNSGVSKTYCPSP